MNYALRLGLLAFGSAALWACAAAPAGAPVGQGLYEAVPVFSQDQEPELPFLIEIQRADNAGNLLHVFGRITALAPWNRSEVVLRLSGYDNGRRKREIYRSMDQAIVQPAGQEQWAGSRLEAGSDLPFHIAIPSEGLSDFELALLWGEEARNAPVGSAAPGGGGLRLEDLRIARQSTGCPVAPCPERFVMTARLSNQSSSVIDRATLGVGYASLAGVDLSSRIPENEERVNLVSLGLQPGSMREIKLNFERAVPEEMREKIQPVLRIIEAY